MNERHKIMCVPEICKGFCCKNIHPDMAKKIEKHLIEMFPNGDGKFTCEHSDEETGLCKIYEERPKVCKTWWCESALFGFMQRASIHLEKQKPSSEADKVR